MVLIGMSIAEFEKFYGEFELAYNARAGSFQYTRRDKLKRRRAAGAGRKHKYSLRDRLLMTLFWLKAYTTYEVLGTLYHLDKTTVEDNLNDVLDTLAEMTACNFVRPQAEIPKLHSLRELMTAFPEVCLIMDANQEGRE